VQEESHHEQRKPTMKMAEQTDNNETEPGASGKPSKQPSHAGSKNGPIKDWNSIRQSWLQPRNIDPPSSSSSAGQAAITSDQTDKKAATRHAKIDQLLADYDEASRLGHPNPKPKLRVSSLVMFLFPIDST
jgi:hypothetical protein